MTTEGDWEAVNTPRESDWLTFLREFNDTYQRAPSKQIDASAERSGKPQSAAAAGRAAGAAAAGGSGFDDMDDDIPF